MSERNVEEMFHFKMSRLLNSLNIQRHLVGGGVHQSRLKHAVKVMKMSHSLALFTLISFPFIFYFLHPKVFGINQKNPQSQISSPLTNHKAAPPTICSFLMFLQRYNNYTATYMTDGILLQLIPFKYSLNCIYLSTSLTPNYLTVNTETVKFVTQSI